MKQAVLKNEVSYRWDFTVPLAAIVRISVVSFMHNTCFGGGGGG